MTTIEFEALGETLVNAITYARDALGCYGVTATTRSSIDEVNHRGTFAVCVAGTPVYSLVLHLGEIGACTGRWDADALRAVCLGSIADKVEASKVEAS